jgi:acyl carrier protein
MMIRKLQSLFSNLPKAGKPQDETAAGVDDGSGAEQKVKAIMASVFKIDIEDITAETSADNIDRWTSIEHVDFLVKLQQEFEVDFTDSQIVEMLTYQSVMANVTAALATQKGT